MSVPVSAILARKGAEVATITPDAQVAQAVAQLRERDIGGLVVSSDGRRIDGIVTERDLVRHLAQLGPGVLDSPVREVMSSEVITCTSDTTCDELMATMTAQRVRHVPVVAAGELAGIVSIGDVVKSRLDELEVQAQTLEQYVTGIRG